MPIEKICNGCNERFVLSKDEIGFSDENQEIFINDAICPKCKTVNHCWIRIKI